MVLRDGEPVTAQAGLIPAEPLVVGACPASVARRRACGLRSAIYQNGSGSLVNQKAVEMR
jgi:hypothetical protein